MTAFSSKNDENREMSAGCPEADRDRLVHSEQWDFDLPSSPVLRAFDTLRIPRAYILAPNEEARISPELREYVSEHYEAFSKLLETRLERGREIAADLVARSNLRTALRLADALESSVFRRLPGEGAEDAGLAVLHMDLLGYHAYRIPKESWLNATMDEAPDTLLVNALLKHAQKSDALHFLEQEKASLDSKALAQAFRLGLSPSDTPLPMGLSWIGQFITCQSACGNPIYRKSDLLSAIAEEGATVQRSDRPLVAKLRGAGDSIDLLRNDGLEDLREILDTRVAFLQSGAIYTKPGTGAQSRGVLRLEYEQGELSIRGDEHLQRVLRALKTPEVDSLVSGSPSPAFVEEFDYEGGLKEFSAPVPDFEKIRIIMRQDGPSQAFTPLNGLAETIELIDPPNPVTGHQQIRSAPLLAAALLSECALLETTDGLELSVAPENLRSALAAIHLVCDNAGETPYAEEAIDSPLVDGKTTEIRVINLRAHTGEQAEPFYSYAKVGGDAVLGGLAVGGQGGSTEDILAKQYLAIRPELADDPAHLETLVQEYVQRFEAESARAVTGLVRYFRSAAEANPSLGIPPEEVRVDAVSTDYMAKPYIDEATGERKLTPVLIDCNIFFGYQGLKSPEGIPSIQYTAVSSRLAQLRAEANEYYGSLAPPGERSSSEE